MRAARSSGNADAALEVALEQAKRKFSGLLVAVDDDLGDAWRAWDDGDIAARQAAQKKMVALLDRRRYLSNLVRDVTEVLGA
jgi:molecular chaperone HscB